MGGGSEAMKHFFFFPSFFHPTNSLWKIEGGSWEPWEDPLIPWLIV